jgi:hypothetical protein
MHAAYGISHRIRLKTNLLLMVTWGCHTRSNRAAMRSTVVALGPMWRCPRLTPSQRNKVIYFFHYKLWHFWNGSFTELSVTRGSPILTGLCALIYSATRIVHLPHLLPNSFSHTIPS